MAADYIGREDGNSNSAAREVPVADGVTVTSGDFVTLVNGRATAASIAKKRLLGVVMGGDTRKIARSQRVANTGIKTATGNTAGTVKVLVNQEPSAKYLLKFATGTASAADEGKYFNLTGATGAQTVTNTAVADLGQLILVKANPGIRGTDNTYGIFRVADKYDESAAALV